MRKVALVLAMVMVMVFSTNSMAAVLMPSYAAPGGAALVPITDGFRLDGPATPAGYCVGIAAVPSPLTNDYVLATRLHFDMSKPTELGFIARANLGAGTTYMAALNPLNGYLSTGRAFGPNDGAPLQIPAQYGFDPYSKDYWLVLNVKGASLTAAVFDVNPDGSRSAPILSISGSSTAYTSGQIGVIDLLPTGGGADLSGIFLNSTVDAVLEGDANLSGKTDVADLTLLLNNYNKTSQVWTDGDFNGDGLVNVDDLTNLLNSYNKTVGSVSQSSLLVGGNVAVPEPSTICLALSSLAVIVVYWLRKRR